MTSYQSAGVDIEGAGRHVGRIASAVVSTWGPDVVGEFGGFAAGIRIPSGYVSPILMMTTDGVGTKLELARRSGQWDGVGHDLVAMCVDDLAVLGAKPIGFVDYMAVGSLDPVRDETIVASIAEACLKVGTPLLGGETAEHPGVMEPDAVDLAAAALGVVEETAIPGPTRVNIDDVIVGVASPNLRSNGFSLIRKLFENDLDQHIERFLEPSVLYSPSVLEAMETGAVHSAAHITGGGLVENLPRAIPQGLGAEIEVGSWEPPEVFKMIESRGVSGDDMYRTFNMGIGFCLIVERDQADLVIDKVGEAVVIGRVTGSGGLTLV